MKCGKKGCNEPRLDNQYLCAEHKRLANQEYNRVRRIKRAAAKLAKKLEKNRPPNICCVCEKERYPLILLTKRKGVCWGCYPTYQEGSPF